AMREFLRSTAPESEFVQRGTTAHPAPAVLRQWRGVVKPDRGDEYLAHLHRETLPSLSRLPGFVTLTIARREVEDGTEFQVVTLWRSLEDIKTFAGDDVTRAVVPPVAQALMVRCDERAVHYEIVSGRW